MDRRIMAVVTSAVLLTACGSSGSPSSPATTSGRTSAPSSAEATSPLVGTWQRVTRCEELVAALTEAGLERWVPGFIAGNRFIPGVEDGDPLPNPSDPCEGAVPREHAHLFEPDGTFGSLDWRGEQVDDGTYEITDADTFVVSKEFPDVTFQFTVQGDTIAFDPVIPECAPKCFEAAWSVTVAYPGETWERVS